MRFNLCSSLSSGIAPPKIYPFSFANFSNIGIRSSDIRFPINIGINLIHNFINTKLFFVIQMNNNIGIDYNKLAINGNSINFNAYFFGGLEHFIKDYFIRSSVKH